MDQEEDQTYRRLEFVLLCCCKKEAERSLIKSGSITEESFRYPGT